LIINIINNNHPGKNQIGGERSYRISALVNEVVNVLLGKDKNPDLSKGKPLVEELD